MKAAHKKYVERRGRCASAISSDIVSRHHCGAPAQLARNFVHCARRRARRHPKVDPFEVETVDARDGRFSEQLLGPPRVALQLLERLAQVDGRSVKRRLKKEQAE